MSIRLLICLLAAGFLCASSADAQFVDKRLRKGGFGIKAGLVSQTTISFSGHQYGSKFAMSGGIFFEFPLSDRFMLGLSGDLHNVIMNQIEDNEPFLDVSVGPKYLAVVESANIAVKPGAAIGFGYLGPMGPKFARKIARTSYMTWRISSEVLFLSQRQHAYLTELVLMGTAFGRNSEVEVTTNPTFLIRFGIMY
jgi:hypothetical protein